MTEILLKGHKTLTHPSIHASYETVSSNIVEPELKEQSDQGLLCLTFYLHLIDTLLYGKTILLKF